MSLRVAVVTESFLPALNGVTNSVLRVLEHLKDQGHQALVIAPEVQESHWQGFETKKVSSVPIFQFQLGLPSGLVNQYLDEFQPDVVHVASPVLLGQQAIQWADRNDVPSVAIFQTHIAAYTERYGFKPLRPLIDKFVKGVHSLATINLVPNREMDDYLTGLGVRNTHIWGRGVDLETYHPRNRLSSEHVKLREKFAPEGQIIIGYVGRLAAEKQVERFAELLDIPNTVFLLVGDGPKAAELQRKLNNKRVIFTGALSGKELAQHYAAMDVFVHFGVEETFGQTIQEAQATGLPVVAPNAGGPKFLIEHGSSGYLIENASGSEYRSVISDLVASENLRSRIGEGGRRAVLNKSWTANNQKLVEYYYQALAEVSSRNRLAEVA